MEKPLKVYNNVAAFKEWPTDFELLFQAYEGVGKAINICEQVVAIWYRLPVTSET